MGESEQLWRRPKWAWTRILLFTFALFSVCSLFLFFISLFYSLILSRAALRFSLLFFTLFSFLFSYFLGFPHTHTADDVVVAWGTLHFTSELPTYILFWGGFEVWGRQGRQGHAEITAQGRAVEEKKSTDFWALHTDRILWLPRNFFCSFFSQYYDYSFWRNYFYLFIDFSPSLPSLVVCFQ